MADYAGTSLTIGPHPMALRRAGAGAARRAARERSAARPARPARPRGRRGHHAAAARAPPRDSCSSRSKTKPASPTSSSGPDLFTEQRRDHRRRAVPAGRRHPADPGRRDVGQSRARPRADRRRARAAVARFPVDSARLSHSLLSSGPPLAPLSATGAAGSDRMLEEECQRAVSGDVRCSSARLYCAAVRYCSGWCGLHATRRSDPRCLARRPPRRWPSCGSSPSRDRDLFWGVGGKRLAPDPARATPSSRSSARGFSRGYTVEGSGRTASGARSFRPKRRPKWSRRGSSGASATTSRRSTTSPSGTRRRRRRRTRSCRRGSARRTRPARPRRAAILVVLPEPLRRHPRAERPARAPGDARQLGPEGRSRTSLYTLTEPFEGAQALVRRARPRPDVRPHRRHRRAARRSRGVRADAVHQGRRRRQGRSFDYRGRHGALFDDITPPTSAGSASGCSG